MGVLVLERGAMKLSCTVSLLPIRRTERIRASIYDTIGRRAFGQERMIGIDCRGRAGVFRRRCHGW